MKVDTEKIKSLVRDRVRQVVKNHVKPRNGQRIVQDIFDALQSLANRGTISTFRIDSVDVPQYDPLKLTQKSCVPGTTPGTRLQNNGLVVSADESGNCIVLGDRDPTMTVKLTYVLPIPVDYVQLVVRIGDCDEDDA
jgi:hypothetical protein